MDRPNLQKIEAGIAAYEYEQRVLLRLLRFKGGSFTSEEFDRWFSRPPKRRWVMARFHPPDGFIGLGCDMGGFSWWALWLELLQCLAQLGKVETKQAGPGRVIYQLPEQAAWEALVTIDPGFRDRLEEWAAMIGMDYEEVLVQWGYACWWPRGEVG